MPCNTVDATNTGVTVRYGSSDWSSIPRGLDLLPVLYGASWSRHDGVPPCWLLLLLLLMLVLLLLRRGFGFVVQNLLTAVFVEALLEQVR